MWFVQTTCKPYYAPFGWERRSLPPKPLSQHAHGRVFSGIDSGAGIVWRCSDSAFAAGFLAACEPGQRSGPLLAVGDAQPTCRTRFMRKCSAGSWPWSLSVVW